MSFFVACQCGRAFEVAGDHPGGSATCPDCGREVAVAGPPPASGGATAEPVDIETVDAERAGDLPSGDPPPGPRSPFPDPQGGARPVDLRASGAGCFALIAAVVAAAVAVPPFGAALVTGILSCCVLPILVLGAGTWWRLRQFKQMLDPNRRPDS